MRSSHRAGQASTTAGSRAKAWQRTLAVTHQAEALGFESVWLFDHYTTVPKPKDELTFESFTSLAALAAVTKRVRLGHIVICTAFRNPRPDGQDDQHDGRHQRRPDGARDRGTAGSATNGWRTATASRRRKSAWRPCPTTSR